MKFLIVDEMHDSIEPLLNDLGIETDYEPKISKESIISKLADYEGLVVRSKVFVDEALLANADRLKFICRAGAGIDNLDVAAIEAKDIEIINAPEGNRNAVAEHCIGLILSLLNHQVKSDKEVRDQVWDREGNRGVELAGKTVGLIGYGHMGQAVASKLGVFQCRVLAYDKYKTGFSNNHIEEAAIDQIFAETDILSIHIPLTSETQHLVDEAFLNNFKKPIWLINTARGGVLSLEALLKSLKSGGIKAAALDVLENEKVQTLHGKELAVFRELASLNNVIFTPHVAGWSVESYRKINEVLADKLKEALNKA